MRQLSYLYLTIIHRCARAYVERIQNAQTALMDDIWNAMCVIYIYLFLFVFFFWNAHVESWPCAFGYNNLLPRGYIYRDSHRRFSNLDRN